MSVAAERRAILHPHREAVEEDVHDADLAARAAAGDRAALGALVARHQAWIYGMALRMTRDPTGAADLAQEALVRVVTRVAQFAGKAGFRTWAYRIVVSCFLDAKRSRGERFFQSFARYGELLEELPLSELEVPEGTDRELLVEDAKVGCMLGMLLCLTREQRIAFILGVIFEVPSAVAGVVLELTPAAYRKRLERARADLGAFMNDQCGLVDPSNPCRCPQKTNALVREGWVDPRSLRFVDRKVHLAQVRAPALSQHLEALIARSPDELFREHATSGLAPGPDFAAELDRLFGAPELPHQG